MALARARLTEQNELAYESGEGKGDDRAPTPYQQQPRMSFHDTAAPKPAMLRDEFSAPAYTPSQEIAARSREIPERRPRDKASLWLSTEVASTSKEYRGYDGL